MPHRRVAAHHRDLAVAYLGVLSIQELRLDRVVDQHIRRVIDASDGNLTTAAELLGVHRRTLQRYVRRRARARSS